MLCIKNGLIHDAVNREAYKGDILIENGKISAIGSDISVTEGTLTQRDCRYIRDLLRHTVISDSITMLVALKEMIIMK